MKITASACFAAVLGLLIACSSAPKLGESCTAEGSTSECEDVAACGKAPDGKLVCQKRCTDQAQCAATESCNGLTGSSVKTCRVK